MRILLVLTAVLCLHGIMAQNLVPDPGFESFKYCPVTFNQGGDGYFAVWKQPTFGTSDYFNACSRIVGTPRNEFGVQKPRSGKGYAGLVMFSPSQPEYREYLQVKLKAPLKANTQYCVKAYFSLADNATFMVDGMGMLLTQNELRQKNDKRILASPQISNPRGHVVREEVNWWELSGIMQAAGGEQYLTLGNFTADRELIINRRPPLEKVWDLAYYFVEDVEVVEMTANTTCSCTADRIARIMIYPGLKEEQYSKVQTENVLFAFDRAELDAPARSQLTEVAGIMAANAEYYLRILGHTDIVGAEVYNDTLSLQRAEAVRQFLQEKGIAHNRLSIDYFGSRKPIASNKAEKGRSQNRRVEFVILRRNYETYNLE